MKFYEKQTKQFCNNSIDLYNVDIHTQNKVRTACSMQYFIYTKFIAFKTFHISDM